MIIVCLILMDVMDMECDFNSRKNRLLLDLNVTMYWATMDLRAMILWLLHTNDNFRNAGLKCKNFQIIVSA